MNTAIRAYLNHYPQVEQNVYVDAAAVVIGQVSLAEHVSVWPMVVIRGDVNHIKIGTRSNIQDASVLHVSKKSDDKPEGAPLLIGEDVTVGHKVMLHGCTIGNRVLIGMGAIVLDDVVIEDDVIVGAGSLVPPRKILQSGYLYMGSPVRQIRALSEEEKAHLLASAQHYMRVAADYLSMYS
ncbi:MAG: gamma carbonic anhydrase family protein [Alysiella sp.]|uniref:gamma carbonic anhydrase family protein n=1 Tax=Alysiella sp. TaxID=1872483 RepID=UPI0026DC7E00|nr:gamma carbonic anhydrase family protein [Alysiella sp.]MDO4433850.1 gamma carbonic anhydrase family protein [Alysiella sp.]